MDKLAKKQCSTCKKWYPLSEKYWGKMQKRKSRPSQGYRFTAYCRDCKNARARAWRAKQPAAKLSAIQRRNKANRVARIGPEAEAARIKRIRILRHYGLTLEEYEQLLSQQKGRCKICQAYPQDCHRGVLSVDHNHETGEIRGLLCTHCNSGLAMFEDRSDLLRLAADYIDGA